MGMKSIAQKLMEKRSTSKDSPSPQMRDKSPASITDSIMAKRMAKGGMVESEAMDMAPDVSDDDDFLTYDDEVNGKELYDQNNLDPQAKRKDILAMILAGKK